MRIAFFDTESDDLLDYATTIHCVTIMDFDTDEVRCYDEDDVAEGIEALQFYDVLIAHNGIKHDLPLIKKLTGGLVDIPASKCLDTWKLAQLVLRNPIDVGLPNFKLGTLAGYLGLPKSPPPASYKTWTPEFREYAIQDVYCLAGIYYALFEIWETMAQAA